MKIYLYSPFSPSNVIESNNPPLLLQFILKELFKNPKAHVLERDRGPFNWIAQGTSAEKLCEYFSLLPIAFPELIHQIPSLDLPVQEIFNRLEPFILTYASNENLLLFLLHHQKELAVKPLLDRICPEGHDVIKERITSGFRKRGYYFTRWTH
jgi:hypothetical protein